MKLSNLNYLCLVFLAGGCALCPPDYGYRRPFDFGLRKQTVKAFDNGSFRTNYDCLVQGNEKVRAKDERNRILGEMLYAIDAAHGQFTRDAVANKAWLDVGSDLAILGLSGAGAVVGGEATKSILAAIAAGVQGAQMTVNKRVFREQAVEALQAQMRAAMMKRKAEILQRMQQSVDDYPLDLALSDIVEYYYDGTFTRAFQNLVSESKKQEEAAADNVSQVIRRAPSEQDINDMGYITDQLKVLANDANQQQALARAKRILAAWGIDTAHMTTREQAVQKLADLREELNRPENREQLPKLRKLFEATQ